MNAADTAEQFISNRAYYEATSQSLLVQTDKFNAIIVAASSIDNVEVPPAQGAVLSCSATTANGVEVGFTVEKVMMADRQLRVTSLSSRSEGVADTATIIGGEDHA
jgi:hypothetical protein